MRRIILSLLLVLPWFVAPALVWGADPKPKAAKPDLPKGGDMDERPAAVLDPADAKAGGDSDKADPDTADSDKPPPRKTGSRPTSIAVTPLPDGVKTLTIHFRWSLYPKASVEVRMVPSPIPKGGTVPPINFSAQLKGKVQDALYACLDHTSEGGWTHRYTKDKLDYKMIGRRNSLGCQGVHVYVCPEGSDMQEKAPPKAPPPGVRVGAAPQLADMDIVDPNPAVAYLQLDTWAVDRDTLSLDLAREEFAKPGTLFVWFFRGDRVVWEEQVRWAGYR